MIGFPEDGQAAASSWSRRRESPVFATGGMVATQHPLATEAGLRVLAQGGNAVDAAVCAGLAAGIVMPAKSGIGGDVFAIIHAPTRWGAAESGETVAVHGSGIAPRGATIEQMREHGDAGGRCMPQHGPLSVAVPGAIDAYFALLDRFGTRSFAELAEPAIRYAADGFPITPGSVRAIARHAHRLAGFPTSAAVFLPDGRVPAVGQVLRQPDLGRTLRQIADGGRDVFYRGDIGRRIGRFMAENGGALAAEDFVDHATDISAPLTTTYRGYTVYQTSLPTQGMIVLESLNIVEQADVAAVGPGSAAGVHLLVEALKLSFADRLGHAGDPAFVDTPLAALLSKEWAARRYGRIDPERAAEEVPAGELRGGDTTYLCAVDGDGMMVSLIQSISEVYGSGVVAGGTGILLNNRAGHCFSLEEGHPNVFAPGKKTMHTLNCYLIADLEGQPVLVGGTPGGDRQPQSNVQTITGLIDAGLDVQAAIEQPRWTLWPGTYPIEVGKPFELRVEDRLGEAAITELERRGHRISRLGPWGAGGAVQVIARNPESGVLAGGSDPRAEGLALGF